MMRSLFSGVSGLRTHQTRMDVIGNNIANVNTTAYKTKLMNFSDMLSQTTQAATGANAANGTGGTNPRQIGLGVRGAAINAVMTEGANQSTGNPFDLKISGNAFFVVSDGTNTFYTRDGSFNIDNAGNLCMASTGYIVQGWGVDQDGNIVKGSVGAINTNARGTYEADATKNAQITGIIDKNDIELQTKNGKIVNIPLYDKAGYEYNLKFGILPVKADVGGVRNVTNTETEHTLDKIYKVDTSTLTFKYQNKDAQGNPTGEWQTLSDSLEPKLMDKLKEAIWKYVAGDTTNEATYGLAGKHVLGEKETVSKGLNADGSGNYTGVKIDLQKFINSNSEFAALDNGVLKNITELRVEFSGSSGYIKSSQPLTANDYPLSDKINVTKVSDKAVETLYKGTGTGTPPVKEGAFDEYTLKDATKYSKVTVLKQNFDDDDGNTITKYVFKDNTGAAITDITDELGSGVETLLKNLYPSTKTNIFTTQETKQIPTVQPGKYTISLVGMLDSAGKNVDISKITSGTSSWNIEYNTSDGSFKFVGADGNNSFDVNLGVLGDNFENVKIDMSGTENTNNNNKSTLEGKRLDGRQVGKLLGVSVGTDGVLTASYSNGQSMAIGQLCVAKFANAMGLENAGDNLYRTTANSGDASLVDIKAEGIGSITSGVLEMSNVDLSQQFTDMITTQRGFQANSRIITVSDTLLEELTNLKR